MTMSSREGLRQRQHRQSNRSRESYSATNEQPPGLSLRCGLLCGIATGLLSLLFFIPVLVLILDFIVPDNIDPVSFSLPSPPKLEGPLAPNNVLTHGEHIYENQLKGPESLIINNGDHIYTGTSDGQILHIHKGQIHVVARLGKPPCGQFEDEPTCGRPLGMRFDKEGYLIVLDAYLGLFKVNVVTGDFWTLISASTEIGGKQLNFPNDLDIGQDGTIYFTDSSYKWDRRHNRLLVSENGPCGRLLKYEPSSNRTTVLAENLFFPNGVQLSRSEDYVLVTETNRARVLRYHLKGPKAGKIDIFCENLPGLPDNIRLSRSGGYWITAAVVRHADRFSAFDFTSDKPWIRRLAAKLIDQERILNIIGKPYGLVMELNTQGHIIRSLHDPTGQVVPSASEVEDQAGILYLGSYFAPFIVRVRLQKNI